MSIKDFLFLSFIIIFDKDYVPNEISNQALNN